MTTKAFMIQLDKKVYRQVAVVSNSISLASLELASLQAKQRVMSAEAAKTLTHGSLVEEGDTEVAYKGSRHHVSSSSWLLLELQLRVCCLSEKRLENNIDTCRCLMFEATYLTGFDLPKEKPDAVMKKAILAFSSLGGIYYVWPQFRQLTTALSAEMTGHATRLPLLQIRPAAAEKRRGAA